LECEVEEALLRGYTGKGVEIGLVDTGTDDIHPDLAGKLSFFKDFVSGIDEPTDPHGHGTACAGMAVGMGAVVPKFHGTAPTATYSMARVLAEDGYGYSSWIIQGLDWLAHQNVDIISVSIGSPNPDYTILSRALDRLARQDIIVCVAAGNWGPSNCISQPANAYGGITCAACDQDGNHCRFSSVGPATGLNGERLPKPDVMWWGQNVALLRAAGTTMGQVISDHAGKSLPYVIGDGTSFSTPGIAGMAALLLESGMPREEIKIALMSSAAANPDHTYEQEGAGNPRIAAAIDRNYKPIPPSPPAPKPQWYHTSCLVAKMGLGWGVPTF